MEKFIRTIFILVGAYVGHIVFRSLLYLGNTEFWPGEPLSIGQEIGMDLFFAIIFGVMAFRASYLLNSQGVKVIKKISNESRKMSASKLIFGIFGLVMGFIIAFLLSIIYMQIKIANIGTVLTILTYIIFGYLGVVFMGERGDELFNQFIIEKKFFQFSGKEKISKHSEPKILDTSVIIDGRIVDIMKTGFLEGNIIIPEFVLVELRHIADSGDALKRNRGKRGLEILNQIKSEYGIDVYNTDDEKALNEISEVDVKLLKLAQIIKGCVVTNDYNLNRVAKVKDIKVLNINELANAVKPIVLPDEILEVMPVKEGKEKEQALAYMDDGTMIVIEDGKKYIGKSIKIRTTTVLQTAAGRMIFGRYIK